MEKETSAVTGEIYHVFNKSIAGFKIFNTGNEFTRMKGTIRFYQREGLNHSFSKFLCLKEVERRGFENHFSNTYSGNQKMVQIVSHCIMPTHLHLILKQLVDGGISTFIKNALDSYSRYFNTKIRRKGPLWVSRSKKVIVKTDEQLLHLTRYLHINPPTAHLVDNPQDWKHSSYNEYITFVAENERICDFHDLLDIVPSSYREFIEDQISYQRDLHIIKKLILE